MKPSANVNIDHAINLYKDAMQACTTEDSVELLRIIKTEGFDPNFRPNPQQWPLVMVCAYFKFSRGLKLLIEAGGDVNAVEEKAGNSALVTAATQSAVTCLRDLLNAGAKVNHVNKKGYTALMSACFQNDHSIVSHLLNHEADISLKTLDGKNALDYALEKENYSVVSLIEKFIVDSQLQQASKRSGVIKI